MLSYIILLQLPIIFQYILPSSYLKLCFRKCMHSHNLNVILNIKIGKNSNINIIIRKIKFVKSNYTHSEIGQK